MLSETIKVQCCVYVHKGARQGAIVALDRDWRQSSSG